MNGTIKIALVGAGMFGGDVHLRAYADLQRFGIAGQLARVGLDHYSRDLASVKFELVAIATHSQKSARRARAAEEPNGKETGSRQPSERPFANNRVMKTNQTTLALTAVALSFAA